MHARGAQGVLGDAVRAHCLTQSLLGARRDLAHELSLAAPSQARYRERDCEGGREGDGGRERARGEDSSMHLHACTHTHMHTHTFTHAHTHTHTRTHGRGQQRRAWAFRLSSPEGSVRDAQELPHDRHHACPRRATGSGVVPRAVPPFGFNFFSWLFPAHC